MVPELDIFLASLLIAGALLLAVAVAEAVVEWFIVGFDSWTILHIPPATLQNKKARTASFVANLKPN